MEAFQKRGRYWVILNREGHVIGSSRYRTKREAQTEYTHYLRRRGDLRPPMEKEEVLPPERVPRGYQVRRTGYVSKIPPRDYRREKLVKAGEPYRFRKNGD